MYAASVEGLNSDQRADFDARLAPVGVRRPLALPSASRDRPALRAVPDVDPERVNRERLAAIRALGGEVSLGAEA